MYKKKIEKLYLHFTLATTVFLDVIKILNKLNKKKTPPPVFVEILNQEIAYKLVIYKLSIFSDIQYILLHNFFFFLFEENVYIFFT